ncbi:MAG TPA: peptidase domain-containing ABC transporter [Burkholderiaceae bacterium]|nr:peptidase domain-containing ABC transporter [Burkholderiaceae bacterium]
MSSALHLGLELKRLPLVLQSEAAECGLACLAMIASWHGLKTDLPNLRRRFSLSLKGCSAADLLRLAERLQLNARAVRAELDQLPQLQLPCVLHWDLNHFVVLSEVGARQVVIHDPAHGVRRMSLDEASRHFSGVALELSPAVGFTPREERQRVSLSALLGPITGLKRSLLQIFTLALALEGFMLLSPFLLQWVVDGVLVSADRELLVTLGVGFGLLVLIQVATGAIRSWAVLYLSASLNLQWLSNVFAHLLRLPVAWFEKRHTGDVWSRFGAVQQMQRTLTTSFIEALLDGLLVVVTLAVMLVYSTRLSAIALGAVAAYALLRWAFFRPLRDATEEALVHDAKKSSHFLESLRGVQAIKLHNRQADRRSRFMNLVVDTMNADLATRKLELAFGVLNKTLFGLERVIVVWVGALLVLDHHLSVGMLFAFIAYKEQFALRFSALVDKTVELKMLGLQGERLADIVLAAPEREGDAPARNADALARIELQGVQFAYSDTEAPVLKGLNLAIEPGESVAIAGPSGCGKTTLLKLILGIHAPQAGELRVGGKSLAQFGLSAWRDRVGTVMQDDQLFAGSIADNISFFDAQADLAWVQQCAGLASVHDEIESMPMGYDTLVGEMGASISGGQKQRILLARALYKRPQILLLDEATSALDVDRERLVNQAVKQLQLTRIIVAHRPETLASASRVIMLHEGRVAHDLRSVATGR